MSNIIVPTLPPKSTPLERAIVLACASLGDIPVPIRTLWNPDECPVAFLPHLAWTMSVDRWDDRWSEATKRAAIKASYYIHLHKGTVAAVRRVVETLGFLIKIIEWWQTEPRGPRGTFSLEIGVLDSGITDEMFSEMERLIDDAKPESRHLTGLVIQLESRGMIDIAIQVYDGDETTVYPWTPDEIEAHGTLLQTGAPHLIDTMTIYP